MLMPADTEAPDWIAPGTPALVIAGRERCLVTEVSIAKVYKRYFTVSGPPYSDKRFRLDRQTTPSGDSWTPDPVVVPLGSPRAERALAAARRRAMVADAVSACDAWMRSKTRTNRLAAIHALQAVEDE